MAEGRKDPPARMTEEDKDAEEDLTSPSLLLFLLEGRRMGMGGAESVDGAVGAWLLLLLLFLVSHTPSLPP